MACSLVPLNSKEKYKELLHKSRKIHAGKRMLTQRLISKDDGEKFQAYRQELCQYLKEQVDESKKVKQTLQQLKLEEEKEFLATVQSEITRAKEDAFLQKVEQRDRLLNGWRRDNHIKTIANVSRKFQ